MLTVYDGTYREFDDTIHRFTIAKLSDLLTAHASDGFDLDRTQKVIRILVGLGVGKFFDDPFADRIFQVTDNEIQHFFNRRIRSDDLFGRAWNLGLDWLKTAFDKTEFWEEFDREPVELVAILPRFENEELALDHNSKAYQDAAEAFDELLKALETTNDVGNLSEDEIEEARVAVKQLKAEIDGDFIELPGFANRARLILTWIGKEAAGAVVGGLAIAALVAVANLIGISF